MIADQERASRVGLGRLVLLFRSVNPSPAEGVDLAEHQANSDILAGRKLR
jgi:hypothetical protein